jgi:predicted alpha/beta superfamily hydrolase
MMLRIALRRFALATAFGCTLAAPASLLAQEPPTLTFGTIAKISSKILGEERRINVLLPPGYEGSSEKYPVFYLLDGSAHEDYFHAASLVDFMATYGVMPKTIVVGISNVDRKRDFTKPSKDEGDTKLAPTSGGAEKFVAFVEKELIPYVEANYRTDGKSTLFGQSLAGLLATQILLEKPGLFDNYIIVSPSLWWSRSELLAAAPELLKKSSAPGRKVYLSVGKEHPQMVEEAHAFAKLLAACTWPGFAHRFDYLETENHATNGHISLYRGLELLFKQP